MAVGRAPRKVTVTGTAVNLRTGTPNPSRSIYYYASGGANLWLGKTSAVAVAAAGGFPAIAGQNFSLPDSTGDVWAKSDGADIDVYIWDLDL